jgi:hypothetical protein
MLLQNVPNGLLPSYPARRDAIRLCRTTRRGVVEAELGPVDVVINNAVASDAISSSRPMERIATRGWATAFG